jgi:hypothetical protein
VRINSYGNINLKRMTPQNITRLTDLYRDAAAAFEKRLRLLVGLNCIARGEIKKYEELRGRDYNSLLQTVNSTDNPLLHFMQGVVNRHVRNAMMHAGVSSSRSKGVINFVDYSRRTRKENEVIWTMSEFFRRTKNLIITIATVAYLEQLFNFACAYNALAVVRYLRANPPSDLPSGSVMASTSNNVADITP